MSQKETERSKVREDDTGAPNYVRKNDGDLSTDIRMLRYELKTTIERVNIDAGRIKILEEEGVELDRKISTGKGLVYGMLIASGGMGLMVAGKLKSLMEVFK